MLVNIVNIEIHGYRNDEEGAKTLHAKIAAALEKTLCESQIFVTNMYTESYDLSYQPCPFLRVMRSPLIEPLAPIHLKDLLQRLKELKLRVEVVALEEVSTPYKVAVAA